MDGNQYMGMSKIRFEHLYTMYINPPQPMWSKVLDVLAIIIFILMLSFGMLPI